MSLYVYTMRHPVARSILFTTDPKPFEEMGFVVSNKESTSEAVHPETIDGKVFRVFSKPMYKVHVDSEGGMVF